MKTWYALKNENILNDTKQAKLNIMATIDKAVENNRSQTKKITDLIKPANILFIASLVLTAIAIIMHYAIIFCTCKN